MLYFWTDVKISSDLKIQTQNKPQNPVKFFQTLNNTVKKLKNLENLAQNLFQLLLESKNEKEKPNLCEKTWLHTSEENQDFFFWRQSFDSVESKKLSESQQELP